jgi:DNA-binding beta-propeller fold protein YncE
MLRLLPLTLAAVLAATAPAAAAPGAPAGPPSCFGPDDAGGACTALTGFDVERAGDVAVTPDGRFAYVADGTAAAIEILARDPATGALTRAGRRANLDDPTSLAISPDGRHLYAGGASSLFVRGTVRAYAIDAATGALGPVGCVAEMVGAGSPSPGCTARAGLYGVHDVHVSPDGAAVYVAATQGGGANAGALTVLRREPVGGGFSGGACVPATAAAGGACAATAYEELAAVERVTSAPDGNTVYALTPHAVVALNRIAAGPDRGDVSGLGACAAWPSTADCDGIQPLQWRLQDVEVTPDSRQVVVGGGSTASNTVIVFDRADDALSLRACWNNYGTIGCAAEPGLRQRVLLDVALAPGGKTIYAGGMGEALPANKSLLVAYHRDPGTGIVTPGGCALGGGPDCAGGDIGNLLALAPTADGRALLAGFTRVTPSGASTGYAASFALEQPPAPEPPAQPEPEPPAQPQADPPAAPEPLLLGVRLSRPGKRKVVLLHRLSAAATLELRALRDGKPAGRKLRVAAPAGAHRTVLRRAQLRRLGVDGRRFHLTVRAAGEPARTLTLPAAKRGG